jgi:endonuclease-3 related protein
VRSRVHRIYDTLSRAQGHAEWWPAKTPFEVCLGAILVQNTAWTNVETVLAGLRARRLLSFKALHALSEAQLAPLFRSSGTFRVKARRVRAFLDFVAREHAGRVASFATTPPAALRAQLLGVPGIGPETADAIALYAAGHAFFVVDAYTRRVFERLGLLRGGESYAEVQAFFEGALPRDAALYGDYHGQIVRVAKDACRKRPLCSRCPLRRRCPGATAPA